MSILDNINIGRKGDSLWKKEQENTEEKDD